MSPDLQRYVLFLYRFLLVSAIAITLNQIPRVAIAQQEQGEQAASAIDMEFHPRLGEYHYDIEWGPSRVGSGVIVVEKDPEYYVIKAIKKTTGVTDKVYRLRYRGETRINAEDLSPSGAKLEEQTRKRTKVQEVIYPPEKKGSVKIIETRSRDEERDVTQKEYEFFSENGVVDLFSAIFLARSFHWEVGKEHAFSIFIGSHQYQVALDCIGTTTLEVGEKKTPVPAWIIRPVAQKVDDTDKPSLHTSTLIYLSVDQSKDVIKIKSKTGIGTVRLRLVKYFPK